MNIRILRFISLLVLIFLSMFKGNAHSVQVQYCINCNGNLRIWLEHWHGNQSPNSTSMTISLNVNGVVTTQTSAPGGGVTNLSPGSLPGCSSPITYVTGCSGQQNTYNDWVYYDFTGLPQGVPVSFTIVSGNTVFTQDGCGMFPLTVNVTVDAVEVSDQNLCDGAPSTPVSLTSWTNSNPSIGIPASGTGNIPAFTPIGGPGTSATISFTSSCSSGSFDYTVVPSPATSFSVASDNISTSTICLGSTFDFTNSTTIVPPYTIADYLWDFGDGTTSLATDPSHTYLADGTYNVSLSATSDSGCTIISTQQVIVNPFPVVSFIVPDVCAYNSAVFNNTTTIVNGIIASWQWDFGDGNTSTQQNPTNLYANYGTYYPSLIATTDIGCVDTFNLAAGVNVFEVPQAVFNFDSVCEYIPASFFDLSTNNTGPVNWTWDFGDGNTSVLQNPTNLYASEGTYNAELLVQTTNGCLDSVTHQIIIHPKPLAIFTVTDDCLYDEIIMIDASTVVTGSIANWNWNFGDGNTSTQQNTTHLYNIDGVHDVTLIVETDQGCLDTLVQQTTVYPIPDVAFVTAPVCLYDSATFVDATTINVPGILSSWEWNFDDGSALQTNQSEMHLFPTEGDYNIILTVTSTNGCVSKDSVLLTIFPIPVASFMSDTICVNTPPTSLTDQSTITFGSVDFWNWDFGDGNSSNLQNPTNTYFSDGQYDVQLNVTSDFGCVDDTTIQVIVYAKPLAAFAASNTDSCNALTVTFGDTLPPTGNIIAWRWDLGNGVISGAPRPTTTYTNFSNTQNEYYDVELIVLNDLGCYDTLKQYNYIVVRPTPIAEFYADPDSTNMYETEISFINTSVGGDYYNWNFGDNSTAGNPNPSHLYADTGLYEVTLITTTDYGCVDSIKHPVRIAPVIVVFVPNSFTPNGDGVNDDFFFKGFGIIEDKFEFYVYDRWGNKIYETHDFLPWDGMSKGEMSKTDVYIWMLRCYDVFGEPHDYKGHVNLLR